MHLNIPVMIQLTQDKCNSRIQVTGQQHTHDTPTTHTLSYYHHTPYRVSWPNTHQASPWPTIVLSKHMCRAGMHLSENVCRSAMGKTRSIVLLFECDITMSCHRNVATLPFTRKQTPLVPIKLHSKLNQAKSINCVSWVKYRRQWRPNIMFTTKLFVVAISVNRCSTAHS